MKRAFFTTAAFILVVCAAAAPITNSQNKPTAADVKIRQRMSYGNTAGTETVLYIKGPRMRNEMPGSMGFTTILQCDLKRTLMINERNKTYMVSSTDGANPGIVGDGGPTGSALPSNQQPATPPRGGIVNITNTITDTGERKEMFGFTARHIKTSMVKTASPDACDKDQKVETDGWYIDFQYAFECPGQTSKHQPMVRPQQPGCKDEIRTRTIGSAKLGFPLLLTTTVYQPDGRTSTMTQEVLELSREPLSASLFEVPEGYTLAKDMQQLYGMGASMSASSASGSAGSNPSTSPRESSATMSSITNSSSPKKPGVIRIGLVMPKVQLTAGDALQTAEAVRNGFAQHLVGPTVEVVRLSSATIDEARRSQCDYVLYVSMTIKKGGSGGGMFGRAIGNIAGSAAGHIPGGGSAGTASSIKARDEVSLEYNLDHIETAKTVITNKDKAKANSDGEDVISPLVKKAAEAIALTVRR